MQANESRIVPSDQGARKAVPQDGKAKALVAELRAKGRLPAMDSNVGAICSLTSDPLTGVSDLTAVILRDCAMTANIISAANSALYRVANPIKTVSAAVVALGFEKLRSLAVGLSIVKQVSESAKNRNLYRLFAGTYFVGMFATAIGKRLKRENPEELFVMGILSELPRLLLANAFPDRYAIMANKVAGGQQNLHAACQEVFGVRYQDLAAEIAQFWNIPSGMVSIVRGDDAGNQMAKVVQEATRMSDMLFGNIPGGADALASVEKDMRAMLHNQEFGISQFIEQTCTGDQNAARFFKLTPKDVEMMVRIVEWGKVNPAEVADLLAFGAANKELKEAASEDPALIIGQILMDLTMGMRRGADVNRTLLTAMEGIFRCLRPSCVLVAFTNAPTNRLAGRFFLGANTDYPASSFTFPLDQEKLATTKCLKTKTVLSTTVSTDLSVPILQRLNLEFVLLVPIVVGGNGIGLFLIGRGQTVPFNKQEESWAETMVEHVAMAFETANHVPRRPAQA